MNIIYIAVAGVLGYFLFKKDIETFAYAQSDKFKVGTPKARFTLWREGAGGAIIRGIIININIPVTSSFELNVPIDAMTGSVYYRDVKMGSFSSARGVVIKTGQTTNVPIETKLSYTQDIGSIGIYEGISAMIKDLFSGKLDMKKVIIKGEVILGGFKIPYESSVI